VLQFCVKLLPIFVPEAKQILKTNHTNYIYNDGMKCVVLCLYLVKFSAHNKAKLYLTTKFMSSYFVLNIREELQISCITFLCMEEDITLNNVVIEV
jgi:hypothetical protein